jgi:uncharacterized protein
MPDYPYELDRTYLGKGLSFPIHTSLQGGFKLSAAEKNLEESIQIILATKIGERVYRPDFGCRLSELTFAPMNTQTLLLARIYVKEALMKWEPRIQVEGVYADSDPIKGRLDLKILYYPKDTHDLRSIVYPFYLLPPS